MADTALKEDFEDEIEIANLLEPGEVPSPVLEEDTEDDIQEEVAVDEDEDEDEQSTSQDTKSQKRINELTWKYREEERKTQAAIERADKLESRLNNLEERSVKASQNDFDEKYSETKVALAKAVEEGDTDSQLEHMERMTDMRTAVRVRAAMNDRDAQNEKPEPTNTNLPQAAQQWWVSNQWFNQPGYEQKSSLARSIDVQLDAEGWDKETPEYFEELDNRMSKFRNTSEKSVNPKRKAVQSPVAPVSRSGALSPKGKRGGLTRTQLSVAKELGLTTKEELEAFKLECRGQE